MQTTMIWYSTTSKCSYSNFCASWTWLFMKLLCFGKNTEYVVGLTMSFSFSLVLNFLHFMRLGDSRWLFVGFIIKCARHHTCESCPRVVHFLATNSNLWLGFISKFKSKYSAWIAIQLVFWYITQCCSFLFTKAFLDSHVWYLSVTETGPSDNGIRNDLIYMNLREDPLSTITEFFLL